MTRQQQIIDNYGFDPEHYTYCGEFDYIYYKMDHFEFIQHLDLMYRSIHKSLFYNGYFYWNRKSDLCYITQNPRILEPGLPHKNIKWALMEHLPTGKVFVVEEKERVEYMLNGNNNFDKYPRTRIVGR